MIRRALLIDYIRFLNHDELRFGVVYGSFVSFISKSLCSPYYPCWCWWTWHLWSCCRRSRRISRRIVKRKEIVWRRMTSWSCSSCRWWTGRRVRRRLRFTIEKVKIPWRIVILSSRLSIHLLFSMSKNVSEKLLISRRERIVSDTIRIDAK